MGVAERTVQRALRELEVTACGRGAAPNHQADDLRRSFPQG